jgi:hypothetical protein
MGGPLAEIATERGRRDMEAAAADLPELPHPGPEAPVLHLLTGARFWYQTAFCLHTFVAATGESVRAELYDDGSLTGCHRDNLARLGSSITLHSKGDIDRRVEEALPGRVFPTLTERRAHYPNLRKLTDVHLGSSGWKFVLDSDLLFFRDPLWLRNWLRQPDRVLHATDCEESYGYSRALLERLAGAPLPSRVNVGLCGLRSDTLDWPQIEAWCAELIAREGTHYYLEQALVALIAAKSQPCAVAPASDYITRPDRAECLEPRAVMHHYVAESKRWYFQKSWRLALSRSRV